jgi:large subunit ribosomal protein L10
MTTPQRLAKERQVDELADKLERSTLAIFTDYRGLRVADLTNLRNRLRPVGVEYTVAKNTLTRFAAERLGRGAIVGDLEGPTAIAFAYEDPAAATKALQDFIRATRSPLSIKAGLLGSQRLAGEEVVRIAELPGKDELRARLVGAVASPMSSLVGMMNAVLSNLAYALDERSRQLSGGESAVAEAAAG